MNKDNTNTSKAKKTNSPANKKVFDVMKPGKAPASPTSRPVIVGHKKVKEDMFVAGATPRTPADNPFEKHNLMTHGKTDAVVEHENSKQEVEDQSTAKSAPTTSEKEGVQSSKPQDSVTESAPELPTATTEEKSKAQMGEHEEGDLESILSQFRAQYAEDHKDDHDGANEEGTGEPKSEVEADATGDSASVDNAPTSDVDDKADDDLPERTAQKPFTPDDVVAATGAPTLEHAFVSHHKTRSKWWEWVLIFLLIIILGLVALNFLLDAEVISLNRDIPHTHLIK